MGLDMNPMAKPLAGHEDEFRDLLLRLDGKTADGSKKGFLSRLFGKEEDRDALLARFNEISVPPYAAIGAPVVGRDEAADRWVRETFSAGRMPAMKSEAEALEKMAGYHALQAMPECDGFPVYTHAYDYEGVDRTSFRGSFLPLCQGFLGEALVNAAWTNMLAVELGAWGRDAGEALRRTIGCDQRFGKAPTARGFRRGRSGDAGPYRRQRGALGALLVRSRTWLRGLFLSPTRLQTRPDNRTA